MGWVAASQFTPGTPSPPSLWTEIRNIWHTPCLQTCKLRLSNGLDCKRKEASISSKYWKVLECLCPSFGKLCHNNCCWTVPARPPRRFLLLPKPFHYIQIKLLSAMFLKLLGHLRLLPLAFLSNHGQHWWLQARPSAMKRIKIKQHVGLKKGRVAQEAEKHK